MKAVILAAGKGERLGQVTEEIPKPMIPVFGKPVLEHNIELCKKHGVKELYINLHHLPEVIQEYCGDGSKWGVQIRYSMEKELLGTSGAIKKLEAELSDGPFFVLYGDNYSGYDLTHMRQEHEQNGPEMSLALFELEDVTLSGVAIMDDRGLLKGFLEKPSNETTPSHWVSAGLYLINPSVIRHIPNGNSDFARNVIPDLIRKGLPVGGVKMKTKTIGIDTPERLKKVGQIDPERL